MLFQLAVSPFNWIDGVNEDVARQVGVMLDNKAASAGRREDLRAKPGGPQEEVSMVAEWMRRQ